MGCLINIVFEPDCTRRDTPLTLPSYLLSNSSTLPIFHSVLDWSGSYTSTISPNKKFLPSGHGSAALADPPNTLISTVSKKCSNALRLDAGAAFAWLHSTQEMHLQFLGLPYCSPNQVRCKGNIPTTDGME